MRAAVLIVVASLAACKQEPDFSERYEAASKRIGATAKEIDAELDSRTKQAEEEVSPRPDDPRAGQ